MRVEVSLILLPPQRGHANRWCYTAGVIDVVIATTLDVSKRNAVLPQTVRDYGCLCMATSYLPGHFRTEMETCQIHP